MKNVWICLVININACLLNKLHQKRHSINLFIIKRLSVFYLSYKKIYKKFFLLMFICITFKKNIFEEFLNEVFKSFKQVVAPRNIAGSLCLSKKLHIRTRSKRVFLWSGARLKQEGKT